MQIAVMVRQTDMFPFAKLKDTVEPIIPYSVKLKPMHNVSGHVVVAAAAVLFWA